MKAKFSGFCQKGSPYKKFKRLEECISAPLIIREKGSGTRTIFESECETYNINVEDFLSSYEVDSIPVILNLVKSGAGITFAYDCAMQEGIKKERLKKSFWKTFL